MPEIPDIDRPRTAAQLRALPIGPAFGMREDVVNGQLERRPIAPACVAVYSEATDPISWVDADGAWMLGRYADGSWFRQRMG
jgi:hypothetical protein